MRLHVPRHGSPRLTYSESPVYTSPPTPTFSPPQATPPSSPTVPLGEVNDPLRQPAGGYSQAPVPGSPSSPGGFLLPPLPPLNLPQLPPLSTLTPASGSASNPIDLLPGARENPIVVSDAARSAAIYTVVSGLRRQVQSNRAEIAELIQGRWDEDDIINRLTALEQEREQQEEELEKLWKVLTRLFPDTVRDVQREYEPDYEPRLE